jgi:Domain of unknown function (DUF5666)
MQERNASDVPGDSFSTPDPAGKTVEPPPAPNGEPLQAATVASPVAAPGVPPPGYGPPPGFGGARHVGPSGQSTPGYSWGGLPGAEGPPIGGPEKPRRWAFLRRASVAWAVAALLALSTGGLAADLATTGGSTPAAAAGHPAGFGPGGRGGFPGADGQGVFGTVASVGSGSFTVDSTGSGQTYTVDEQSSTTYRSGSSTSSASAVAVGDRVAVSGSTSGTTVKATTVIILPAGGFGGGGTGGGS